MTAPGHEDEDVAPERAAYAGIIDSDVDDGGIDLFQAVCLLPRVAGRAVDVRACREEVERLAQHAQRAAGTARDEDRIAGLLDVLFNREGYRGDDDSYDDPKNSFVDDVIARKRGLPITLSMLTVAVAEAMGLSGSWCVLLPGHVIAAVGGGDTTAPPLFVDPFRAGQRVALRGSATHAGAGPAIADALVPPAPRAVLLRMLTNLRGSYLRRQDYPALLRVLNRMILLDARNATLFAERAFVHHTLADMERAAVDAGRAESLAKDPDERAAVLAVVGVVRERERWLH